MNIENLKQIKLLMEYKTSLTKDENLEAIKNFRPSIILEQADDVITKVLGTTTKGEIDDVIKGMAKSGTKLQTVDGIIVKTGKELDDVIKNAKKLQKAPFTPQMLGTLRGNLLRSPNVNLASKSTAIDDLINGKSFQKLYGNSSYDDIVKGMKKPGNAFPDDVAEEIAKRHTKGSAGTVRGSGKNTVVGSSNKTTVKNTAGGSKNTLKNTTNVNVKVNVKNVAAKKAAGNLRKNPKFVKKINNFKGGKDWNWRKISAWALGLGITGAALWYFFSDSGEPLPPDFPPTPPVEDGGGGGGSTSTSKYTSCPETFPIAQFCKNETIRKVQACLGMPSKYQTGNFGSITQGYLERKGLTGTEITQNTVDTVCGVQTKPVQQTPFSDDEEDDLGSTTSSSSNITSANVVDDADEA
jgi:hypothetical protein